MLDIAIPPPWAYPGRHLDNVPILPNLQKGRIVLWLSEHGEQFVRPQSFEANSVPVRKYSVPSPQ